MPLDDKTPEIRQQPQTRPEVAANKDVNEQAHKQAEQDIEDDAELTIHPTPENDLDEGELARFEANDTEVKKQDPLGD